MTDATQQPTATTSKAPMVVCVDSYFADLRTTDQWAFTFVPEHGRGRFTIYAPTPDGFRVGASYTLCPAQP